MRIMMPKKIDNTGINHTPQKSPRSIQNLSFNSSIRRVDVGLPKAATQPTLLRG
jgi:hypothetical protein